MRQLISSSGTDYIAFAFTGIVVLILSLIYVWWLERSQGKLSCPGLQSKDENLGNIGEITKAGGFHQFLQEYHQKLGAIFSFYWGGDLAVSVASPALFNDVDILFDRGLSTFEVLKPVSGPSGNQPSLNSVLGQKHRKAHDRHFRVTEIPAYFSTFCTIGEEVVRKWNTAAVDEQVPLTQHMMALAIKSIVRCSFGPDYFKTNSEIIQLHEAFGVYWDDVDRKMKGDLPEAGSERENDYNEKLDFLREKIKGIVNHRRTVKERSGNLLDTLLQEEELYPAEEQIVDIVLSYLIGGYQATGYFLSWAIYFLSLHPEVQEKVHDEIRSVVGDEQLTAQHCPKLNYLEQVIKETIRCSTLTPFASRISQFDLRIGGHVIPKDTLIIAAMGVVLKDPEVFPEPERFNPERFNEELNHVKVPLDFVPLGFGGKEKTPGYRFALYEAFVFLFYIIRNFQVKLVEDQEVASCPGVVTQFTGEVWVKVERRI